MNGPPDPASARRFRWCLALSVVLTTVGFSWLGRLWAPRALHLPPPERRRFLRFAVLPPPPPKPILVRHVAPKPLLKLPRRKVVVPKPPRLRPRLHRVPKIHVRRATLSAASPRHNPLPAAHPAAPGGAESHAPALAASNVPATMPPLRPPAQRPVLLSERSTLRITLPPVAAYDIPAMPALPAPDTSGGSGTGAGLGQGNGAGSGKGDGRGPGTGNGGGPFGIGSGGTGAGEGPRHVAYVLDVSGSMTSRIDRARQELRDALAGLGPDESFDIITFSDEVHVFANFLNPATPFMVQRADYFLGTLEVRGGTNLEGALTHALELPGVNIVVVITDGVPTEMPDGDAIENIGRYMAEFPGKVRGLNVHNARIYTVGLVGKDPDGRDESFEAAGMLRQIAHDSGGASKIVALGVAVPE